MMMCIEIRWNGREYQGVVVGDKTFKSDEPHLDFFYSTLSY